MDSSHFPSYPLLSSPFKLSNTLYGKLLWKMNDYFPAKIPIIYFKNVSAAASIVPMLSTYDTWTKIYYVHICWENCCIMRHCRLQQNNFAVYMFRSNLPLQCVIENFLHCDPMVWSCALLGGVPRVQLEPQSWGGILSYGLGLGYCKI